MNKKPGRRKREDIEWIADNDMNLERYRNSTVFITGATGLIGEELVRVFLCADQKQNYGIRVVAAVRNRKKAEQIFADLLPEGQLEFCVNDIRDRISYQNEVDYIFHTASITNSKQMVEKPVDTIATAIEGTKNVLEFAREKQIKGMVYLSSMEVYGRTDESAESITEKDLGYVDLENIRSSYPEGKRMCECLCAAYASQYQVPVAAARLAQTFGPGIHESDNRVYAQFARSVIFRRDIVLHSDGTSEGNYCDIRDAVQALLLLGIKGDPGESYNVANEASHMQIREMAQMVANDIAGGKIRVIFDIPESDQVYGYAPKTTMKLSSAKLRKLGWKPEFVLRETYGRMIEDLQEEQEAKSI